MRPNLADYLQLELELVELNVFLQLLSPRYIFLYFAVVHIFWLWMKEQLVEFLAYYSQLVQLLIISRVRPSQQ